MKKLKLKAFEISATKLLTREQLRNVMGKGSIGAYCGGGNDWVCGSDCCVNGYCAVCPTCPPHYFYGGGYCHPCQPGIYC